MFQMFAIMLNLWLKRWDDFLVREGRTKLLVKKNHTGTVTYDSVLAFKTV